MRAVSLAVAVLAMLPPLASGQANLSNRPECGQTATNKCRKGAAWIGDSITNGAYCTSLRPPTLLSNLESGLLGVDNHGVDGDDAVGMLTRWTSTIRPRRYGHLVILCCLNSIRVGTPAATVWATLQTILDQAKADGMRVTPITQLPWKDGLGYDAATQAATESLNTSILAWCVSNSETCVNGYSAMGDPGDPTLLRTTWKVDAFHPNDTGCQQLAAAVSAAIP